jgi:uncharacterized membrane protein YgdD (TMEM256/DUF423 family)
MSNHSRYSTLIAIGALILFVATLLGAYGTHSIKGSVDEKTWDAYQVAVEYQFYHGLGVIVVGMLAERFPKSKWINASGWLLLFGIIVFSGSIYAVTLAGMSGTGAMAPIGGLSIMGGWIALAYGVLRER